MEHTQVYSNIDGELPPPPSYEEAIAGSNNTQGNITFTQTQGVAFNIDNYSSPGNVPMYPYAPPFPPQDFMGQNYPPKLNAEDVTSQTTQPSQYPQVHFTEPSSEITPPTETNTEEESKTTCRSFFAFIGIPATMVAVGGVYMNDCIAFPDIPKYLIAGGSISLLMIVIWYFQMKHRHGYNVLLFIALLGVEIWGSTKVFKYWGDYDKSPYQEFFCKPLVFKLAFAVLIMFWICSPIFLIMACSKIMDICGCADSEETED